MKPVTVDIPHQLGKAEARRRIEEGFGQLQQSLMGGSGTQSWSGDRLTFTAETLGQKVSGRIDVREESVRMEIDLPVWLAALAEKIKGKALTEGRKLLK